MANIVENMMKMEGLMNNFPAQIEKAVSIGRAAELELSGSGINNLIVSGMGGSGIGGNMVRLMIADELKIPMLVNKGYQLPKFAGPKTLLLISSYSGNTEETLSVMSQGIEKGCRIACVSSGGKVSEIAGQHNFPCITVPGGMPPRTCLGYSFSSQLYLLHYAGLLEDPSKKLLALAAHLKANTSILQKQAKALAVQLQNQIPVFYGEGLLEPVLVRFRQQLNENSKMLCWHHVVPEMNHNELVGYDRRNDNIAPVFLKTGYESEKNIKRMEISKSLIGQSCVQVLECEGQGTNFMEKVFFLIYLADWLSLELAKLNEVDPIAIKAIDHLKSELAK